MKKIVFLEGLPGVGKTTIIDHIKEKNLKNVHIVDEIVTDVIQGQTQRKWIENDIKKISMYDEGLIIIDRGPLSTLSYNETLKIINTNDELDEVYDFFNNCISLYEESIVYYLKRNSDNYYIPFNDNLNPYGSIENQKILEKVSINNCKKICKNLKIVNYSYSDLEDIINEIIN